MGEPTGLDRIILDFMRTEMWEPMSRVLLWHHCKDRPWRRAFFPDVNAAIDRLHRGGLIRYVHLEHPLGPGWIPRA